MYLSKLSLALYTLLIASVTAGSSSKPGCVTKCWDNSQYVSQCAGDVKCLCEDSEFQNAVYQCLYSQCQTAQFGSALHHTISFCQEEKSHPKNEKVKEKVKPTVPALIRQQNSPDKRQNHPMMSVSNSVTRSVTRSVTGSVTRSVTRKPMSMSASQYMTYSSSRAIGTMVTQIPDGQIQAPSPGPYPGAVSQISDGQVQAPAPTPVTQIPDGQVQAPAPTPVVQIPDGQVQATAYAALKRAFYDNRKQGHEI